MYFTNVAKMLTRKEEEEVLYKKVTFRPQSSGEIKCPGVLSALLSKISWYFFQQNGKTKGFNLVYLLLSFWLSLWFESFRAFLSMVPPISPLCLRFRSTCALSNLLFSNTFSRRKWSPIFSLTFGQTNSSSSLFKAKRRQQEKCWSGDL